MEMYDLVGSRDRFRWKKIDDREVPTKRVEDVVGFCPAPKKRSGVVIGSLFILYRVRNVRKSIIPLTRVKEIKLVTSLFRVTTEIYGSITCRPWVFNLTYSRWLLTMST